MMMKRILFIVLTCALTLGLCMLGCAADTAKTFSDIPADADHAKAVEWCVENGLMNGVDDGSRFDPDDSMTRAMLAAVLYRQAGSPAVNGAPSFTDAQSGAWYSDAVVWASGRDILRGYGNGLFGVNDPVSREMLAVVMARQKGNDPVWTGDPALAVPAKRSEAAVALYETFYEPDPEPTRRPSGGGSSRPSRPSGGGSTVTPTPTPTSVPTPKIPEDVARPTPDQRQTIYLWADDKIPAWRGNLNSNDPDDFRPHILTYPAQGTAKGAVLICPGGAFALKSMIPERHAIAERLSALGYQSFIVSYRLSPYSQAESALDLARAVRYVRFHAADYGIDERDIAIVGFSAGGILCGEHVLNWKGSVSPTKLDSEYEPDAIDAVSGDVAAVGHIYSFYGRLSVSNNNVETLRQGQLPPTFYAYGTRDPFYSQFNQNVQAAKEAGVTVESHVFEDQPHGFGPGNANSNWIPLFDTFVANIFEANDEEVEPMPKASFTVDTPISEVMSDPAFGDFGRLLFPVDTGYWSGDTLGALRLTWYSHIDPSETVDIVNTLKDNALAGKTVFYDIYTQAEKAADPDKRDTGLFFFQGEAGKPFAICSAGGGFAYVGAMHDSFPHALELSKKGYNAFALIYRPGAQTACEDLARAISFIFENADELGVSTDCYSLWGGSAGGRMTAYLSSYGPGSFGGDDLPRPGASIIQYTGHSDYTGQEPPTFVCVGESDGIANWRAMEARQNALADLGIETEFHRYPGLGHGFGLGTGTVAQGWLDQAAVFWQRQIDRAS